MTQESRLSELHEVCAVGDADLLEEMLISGRYEHVDYKDPDWGERAPLHWCCIKGKSDMTMNLLQKGAHPGVRSSCGWTPAHYAAEGGRIHVIRMLHQHHAPMDRKDLFGDTPRRVAEIYGHKECVEFFTLAEAEYRVWRRKAELTSEAEPYDDEDLEWCYRNDVKPEAFITDDELAEMESTVTTLSVAESVSSSSKGRSKGHHYQKTGQPPSRRRMSISSGTTSSSPRQADGRKSQRRQSVKVKHKPSLR